MYKIPLTGLLSAPIPASHRVMLVDDPDKDLLSCFNWKLVVPSVPRFLATRNLASLLVRCTTDGLVFYPHHLVWANQTMEIPPSISPVELYSLLDEVRQAGIIHIDRNRLNVRRSNLRPTKSVPEYLPNDVPAKTSEPGQVIIEDDLDPPVLPSPEVDTLSDIFSLPTDGAKPDEDSPTKG